MSQNRLYIDGLEELRRALWDLPAALRDEAGTIITGAAEAAAAEVRAAYPVRTGNLRDGVKVETQDGPGIYGVGAVVYNRAPHAHIFELGTQARHTAIGAFRGAMPPGRVFIPAMIRRRRAMWSGLKDLLRRHGLKVFGDAA